MCYSLTEILGLHEVIVVLSHTQKKKRIDRLDVSVSAGKAGASRFSVMFSDGR